MTRCRRCRLPDERGGAQLHADRIARLSPIQALTRIVLGRLERDGVATRLIRVVDHDVRPGVSSNRAGAMSSRGFARRSSRRRFDCRYADGLGQPSSVVKRVLERMDATLSETGEDGRPVAYSRVAGFVLTGNEGGAHHVIAELAQAVIDIGFTVPGQAWTYWNKGPGPGPSYLETDEGHDWSRTTGEAAAANLVAAARALAYHPLPVPAA